MSVRLGPLPGREVAWYTGAAMGRWLGDELRRLRAARGLSLRELAQASGIPHMTYVSYENGKAVPPAQRRPGLAETLGLSSQALDDLIEEDQYEVFLRSRPLSEEGKAAVRDFLRLVREREREHGQEME